MDCVKWLPYGEVVFVHLQISSPKLLGYTLSNTEFLLLHITEVVVVNTTEYPQVPCPGSYTSVYDVCIVKLLFLCWNVNWESICEETFWRYEIHLYCVSTCYWIGSTGYENDNTVESIWSLTCQVNLSSIWKSLLWIKLHSSFLLLYIPAISILHLLLTSWVPNKIKWLLLNGNLSCLFSTWNWLGNKA
jgi:hypothetical protein